MSGVDPSEQIHLVPALAIRRNDARTAGRSDGCAVVRCSTGRDSPPTAGSQEGVEIPRMAVVFAPAELGRSEVFAGREGERGCVSACTTVREDGAGGQRERNCIESLRASESDRGDFWRGRERGEVIEPGAARTKRRI